MNAQVENWVAIGPLSEIPRQGSRRVLWGQIKIAVFRMSDDRVYALEDKCPHKNGPLSEGIVHEGCVTCPLHNWVISLETGAAQGADEGQTRTFPVRVEDDTVLIAF
ncbi:MAG: nitrite reductase small subunit NirD [Thioclava marina]|jgi:assimilatory nitrite reductase (NAD(P)H) small subunit (EC 1.7.1.4)|uniref:tRNA-(Guanine-N1)-methyltransferase n=1 Tax=Thioclava marina TaxID=1915077 RepID=A0ABX3MLN3_9RHOB|nr:MULTISPECIES: nitrite reductase small subunit NirD [Thioclava]TNE92063.1 MAG: nitrite reductase small subunit NirD [Paracoccaceae bacterium]MBC7145847.1 nitrite reductase small subunit NirD [Thioclava marina]MBD3803225.1 nitrite reductase small subunit NirD [Thioclava sp.]OOY11013.1 tRNA-(guanine-N1)-methyltransferase [Thioclava marina]OOY27213.1 tRNA-(guanine-N1)-methyltransferase [Thioclava sp. L04-15]